MPKNYKKRKNKKVNWGGNKRKKQKVVELGFWNGQIFPSLEFVNMIALQRKYHS